MKTKTQKKPHICQTIKNVLLLVSKVISVNYCIFINTCNIQVYDFKNGGSGWGMGVQTRQRLGWYILKFYKNHICSLIRVGIYSAILISFCMQSPIALVLSLFVMLFNLISRFILHHFVWNRLRRRIWNTVFAMIILNKYYNILHHIVYTVVH